MMCPIGGPKRVSHMFQVSYGVYCIGNPFLLISFKVIDYLLVAYSPGQCSQDL